MEKKYTFSFLECQNCTAKVNCDKCEGKIRGALLRNNGVESVTVVMPSKQIKIETILPEDELLDLLELVGVFAD